MKTINYPKVLLLLTALIGITLPSHSAVKVIEGNGVNITMENAAMKLNIAVEGGGRISKLINKKTGKNLVTMWKTPVANGGLLDDRNVFTAAMYSAAVTQPGGKIGSVRLTAKNSNGMKMTKILTMREDEPVLEVYEQFSNGTQEPARFMLRSFVLPDGGPLTEEYQYFLPVKDKPLQPLTPAKGYFANLSSPWSAIWNSKTGNGVMVAAPGIEKFYFWQGSKIFPTYEWVYPNVPAGKSISVHYSIRLINNKTPNWEQLSATTLKGVRNVRFADIPGWQNEAERYNVTEAERERGYWLSTGDGAGKRRLPALRIDTPLNQSRSVYLGINSLKNLTKGDLQVELQNIPKELVQIAWQVSGPESIKVLSFENNRTIDLPNGTEGRLWLTLQGGTKAQEASGNIQISLGGEKVLLPLTVKVWPVDVPERQPFEVRPFSGLTTFFGGYQIGENPAEHIKQANALFTYFHRIGGSMMNWTLKLRYWYPYMKLKDSDQTVAEWIKKNRKVFLQKPASQWPELDLSYFDPYAEAARSNGVTLAGIYLPLSTKENPVTAEQEWMLMQMKKYLLAQGFHGFICKISDEMPPEEISAFIESAKIARRAGWRPSTTITGTVARTASTINQLNPYLDIWVLGKGSTQFFKDLLTQKYTLMEKTLTLPAKKWGHYRNGGAKDTVAQQLFNALIPGEPSSVKILGVSQNGKNLLAKGGSAWGNKERGVYFYGFNNYLYLSPLEGSDANESTITVKYQVRVPSNTGKTLVQIDPTDQIWFYGGGTRSYRNTYGEAAAYPLKAISGNYDGFGWYDFHRWNADKILWYDKSTGTVTVSPAFIGLRDGWNDACLMAWLEDTKNVPVNTFISETPNALLQMGKVQREVYRWKDIVNLTDPFVLNAARAKMLEAAVK